MRSDCVNRGKDDATHYVFFLSFFKFSLHYLMNFQYAST